MRLQPWVKLAMGLMVQKWMRGQTWKMIQTWLTIPIWVRIQNRSARASPVCGAGQGTPAVVSVLEGDLLAGELPAKKLRLVQAWIAIHEEELMADWALAVKGESNSRHSSAWRGSIMGP